MPEPTMVSTHDEVHVGRVAMPSWQAAVDRLASGSAQGAPEELLLQWRAAGIVDESLAIAPDWERAVDAQARARAAVTIVSRQGSVAFLTNLYVCPSQDCAVAVTVRAVAGEGASIQLVNPQAEVASAAIRHLWPLVRRVLPPLDAFRADAPGHRIEGVGIEGTPQFLAAADEAEASVFAYGVDSASGNSDELVWYLAGGVLHRLQPRRREVRLVESGDVAAGIGKLVAGLLRPQP